MTKRDLVILPIDISFKRIHHKNPDEEIVFYPEPEEEKDYGEGCQSVLLKFTLPPGAYATTVLHELYGEHFKAGDGADFHERDCKNENGTNEQVEVEWLLILSEFEIVGMFWNVMDTLFLVEFVMIL